MTVSEIIVREIVLVGNFAGETNELNWKAAENFKSIVTDKIETFCMSNWIDAKLDIKIDLDGASGCTPSPFRVQVDSDVSSYDVKEKITREYEYICAELERSGEIYE